MYLECRDVYIEFLFASFSHFQFFFLNKGHMLPRSNVHFPNVYVLFGKNDQFVVNTSLHVVVSIFSFLCSI
jgi:hypothetical protein